MCFACPGHLDDKQWTVMLAQTSDDRLLIQCDDKNGMIDLCGYLNYAIGIATAVGVGVEPPGTHSLSSERRRAADHQARDSNV